MLDHVFFERQNIKIHSTKLVPTLRVKGFGLISTFCLITSEDYMPSLQKIGLASRCKVDVNIAKAYKIRKLTLCIKVLYLGTSNVEQ